MGGSYSVPGIEEPFEFSLTFDFLETTEGWMVEEFEWEVVPVWRVPGPLNRSENSGAVVFSSPGFPGEEVANLTAQAVDRLSGLTTTTRPPYLIVVANQSSAVVSSRAMAVAHSSIRWTGEQFQTGQPWVAVNHGAYLAAEPAGRNSLVLHELTHVVLSPLTTTFVPIWLSEGLAVHFSGEQILGALKPEGKQSVLEGKRLGNLESDFSHPTLFTTVSDDYAYAGAVVSYLCERFGEKAVLEVLAAYRSAMTPEEVNEAYRFAFNGIIQQTIEEKTGRDLTKRLFKEKFGVEFEEIDSGAKAWVRSRW
ncbi:MAG: peptidase MA family metallohydrolase [Actinomycetota bacterium]